ncbi:LysM peptidoglycan-binding domain-containing protein [uncultured Cellulomonas sp.]|uniref:LysM peptidoglycan-binding domain-containing protein n=1 Tax=uncultured Cellulomonas sp. TaxID=189682 RepID=UPI002637304B|nr:LysM peptidoglycan-binding domain-containing protein [uncultured Cellulomonas sp.]
MTPTYAPTRPAVRTGRDLARGLGAALALTAFVFGVPLVLAVVAPIRWPQSWPTFDSITATLTRPDDGSLLLGTLAIIAWLAWAAFTASVLVEVVASVRHMQAPSLPLLRWAQRGAATLVTTTGLLLSTAAPTLIAGATPVIAAAPGPAHVAPPARMPDGAAAMTGPVGSMTGTAGARSGADAPMTAAGGTVPDTFDVMTTRQPAAVRPETDRYPVITIQRGDTLWSLAERHLGSGHRYTEIRDLNLGQAQPDGGALTDTHWIYPGWQLRLPADATDVPAPTDFTEAISDGAARAAMHHVAEGDTLWDIAATHLGDGARYSDVFDVNVGVPQADGHALTDPDLILPGWEITVPVPADGAAQQVNPDATAAASNVSKPEPPEALEPPAQTMRQAVPGSMHAPVTQPDLRREAPGSVAPEAAGQVDVTDDLPSAGALFLGLTGLAAVGVIGELTRRRHLQQRSRRIGERIAMPAPGSPTDEAEQSLRTATSPLSIPQLKTALLNLTTRAYAAERDLPRIGTLSLSDETLELHLTEDDVDAVAPFTVAGNRVWSAPTAAVAEDELIDDDPDRPEPYPALVTIGHTDDATVIVNLEAAGTLAIIGDPDAACDVLRSLVTELATSDLTGRIGMITGPQFAGLAAASDAARLQCTEAPALAPQHADRSRALGAVLTAAGVDDTLQARSDRTASDTWLPVLYVDTHGAAAWEPPTAWCGSVLLTTAPSPGAWTLAVADDGTALLEPGGVRLRPPRLSEGDFGRLTGLLAAAAAPRADDVVLPASGDRADDITRARAAMSEPASAPHKSASTMPTIGITVLGPIEIHGLPDGARPLGRRSIELLVFLALRGKATGPELEEVLWRGRRVENQTRNSLLYRTRQRVSAKVLAPMDSDGTYRLGTSVGCDWTEFQHLARAGYAAGPDGLEDLQAAMRLVRGRPFSGVTGVEYAWAEHDTQEMVAAIVDAAHVLSAGLLAAGDYQGALSAATHGLLAEPCSEHLYDDAIRAARCRGDVEEADRLAAQLLATLEDLDPEYVG